MGTRAKASTSLEALVKLAMPLLREAERQCPRTGPGAKPIIPDWFVGVLIMVAVLKRKKTKSAQFRSVTDSTNQRTDSRPHGEKQFPSRSTFFSRYRRCHRLFTEAIKRQGQQAIAEQIVDASQVAVDRAWFPPEVVRGTSTKRKRGRFPGVWIARRRGATPNITAGSTATASRWWSLASGKARCFRCWLRWEPGAPRRRERSRKKLTIYRVK